LLNNILLLFNQPQQQNNDWYHGLAMAYQQAALIATAMGQLVQARQHYDKALDIYQYKLLKQSPQEPEQQEQQQQQGSSTTNTVIEQTIGTMLVSLAHIHVQLGEYKLAKARYQECMKWHKDHPLVLIPSHDNDNGDEDAIDQSIYFYREQLEGYRQLWKENNVQEYAIEADIIAVIASFYLSKGELDRAIEMLQQALELYDKDVNKNNNNNNNEKVNGSPNSNSSRQYRRAVADVNIHLAMAFFRKGEFDKSQTCHFIALEQYQILHGDGVNPYTQPVEGMEEFLEKTGFGGYADQLSEAMNTMMVQQQQSGDGKDDDDDDDENDDTPKTKVVVDMEKFKASHRNISLDDAMVEDVVAATTTTATTIRTKETSSDTDDDDDDDTNKVKEEL
jgi:tetratricopeptide (TPR) repeat protein